MHPIFNITVDQIGRLNDGQARELLARLSRAHLHRAGLDGSRVHWGGDQRAADEGIDVLIDHRPGTDVAGPMLRSTGIIQVKAEKFGPAKIGPEMAPKGILRPAIASLADRQGVYLIASTRDNPSAPRRRDRVEAMENLLDERGLLDRVRVDFLGAREIADWVENFPPLVIWLRQCIGDPLIGWRGYGPWAYQEEDLAAPFVLSDGPRIFVPGASSATTDVEGISAIRNDLHGGRSVRLVGLSGVGKTRIAQALFDSRIDTDAALRPDQAIYCDIADRPDPSPEAMVEMLRSRGESVVLIVDNCGQATHSALVEKKGKSARAFGLLTIEYDIRDDIPDETRCYRLEGSSDEALWSVLRAHYPKLSGPDLSTVIAASQGNARLAFALASTSHQTGDLASLKSDELFGRLFEQKRGAGDELLRCARAASLIYSFDGEDLSEGSEMALLGSFADVSPRVFRTKNAEIRRRGLLQERGKMRALLPHAVSNRLASEMMEEVGAGELMQRLFQDAPPRVRMSFTNRLSYLHSSVVAQSIAARLLANDGDLGSVEMLSHHDFKIFDRLAAVDPDATLAAIERFVEKGDLGLRAEHEIDRLTQIVHSIAYESTHFDRCVEVLTALAPLQAASRGREESDLEHLKALFQPYGSGTLASASQRRANITRLLGSADETHRKIGTKLLVEALKVRGFRSPGTFQFGARTRTDGWRPRTLEEHRAWYEAFLEIAEPLATRDDGAGRVLREALGQTLNYFVQDPSLMEHLMRLAPQLVEIDGWLPGLKAVRQLLVSQSLKEPAQTRASEFEELVSPKGIRNQVLAAIAMRDPFDYSRRTEDGEDAYVRAAEHGRALGRQLAADPSLLTLLLPELLSSDVYVQAVSIGQGVASASADGAALMEEIRAYASSVADLKSMSHLFVSGLFTGWAERDPVLLYRLLDQAVEDPILGSWFPRLQCGMPLGEEGVGRMMASIAAARAPIVSYSCLSNGRILDAVPAADVVQILDALAGRSMDGLRVVIDILQVVVYCSSRRSQDETVLLAGFCNRLLVDFDWPVAGNLNDQLDHEIAVLIGFVAKQSASFEEVANLLDRVVACSDTRSRYAGEGVATCLAPLLRRYPFQVLDNLLRQRAIPGWQNSVDNVVLDSWRVDSSGEARPVMNADELIGWCARDPVERVAFGVQIGPLEPPAEGEHSVVERLYELAPSKTEFIEELTARCLRGGSSSEAISSLRAGIRILGEIGVTLGSTDAIACASAVENLQKSLDWWNEMIGRTGRERDEGFE